MSTEIPTAKTQRFGTLFSRNLELVVAILLGLVSIATAYASFQAALYDSTMAGKYATATTLSTQAEFRAQVQTLGFTPLFMPPAEVSRMLAQEIEEWKRTAKTANLKIE